MIIEIFNLMKTIAESHNMINSFAYGDSFNIKKTKKNLQPQFYLETFPSDLAHDKSVKDYSLSFFISDIPSNGQGDDIQLANKIEQINEDILMFLDLKDFAEFESITSNSVILNEWQGDNCVAIRTDINFRIKRIANNCEAPFTFTKTITI